MKPQVPSPLQLVIDQQHFGTCLTGGCGSGQSCRAAAHHRNVSVQVLLLPAVWFSIFRDVEFSQTRQTPNHRFHQFPGQARPEQCLVVKAHWEKTVELLNQGKQVPSQ